MQELLREYVRVEKQFQLDSYDKCVSRMRDAPEAKMADVTADIFSNSHVLEKNILVIELIVSLPIDSCSIKSRVKSPPLSCSEYFGKRVS